MPQQLIQQRPMSPYFLRADYVHGDPFKGTLTSPTQQRLIVFPEELVQGLHKAIEYEAGQAIAVIAYRCGQAWGSRLLKRWQDEWNHYYGISFEDADFLQFEAWLKICFSFHGWGELRLDFSEEQIGLLQFQLKNSVLSKLLTTLAEPEVCWIFAGLLGSLSSHLAGRELRAIEVECAKAGADRCSFAIANMDRIEKARKARLDGANATKLWDILKG